MEVAYDAQQLVFWHRSIVMARSWEQYATPIHTNRTPLHILRIECQTHTHTVCIYTDHSQVTQSTYISYPCIRWQTMRRQTSTGMGKHTIANGLMYISCSSPCNYPTVRSIHLVTCANPYIPWLHNSTNAKEQWLARQNLHQCQWPVLAVHQRLTPQHGY